MAVAIFDSNLKQLHSTLQSDIPPSTIKSMLASLKSATPMKENFSFTIYLDNEDYICYSYGKKGVAGLSDTRRFALFRTEDVIVVQFQPLDSPESCFESTKRYAQQIQSQDSVAGVTIHPDMK